MRVLIVLALLVSLTACSSLVPAKEPPQLDATAGAPIIITDEIVDAGLFTVDYPDGWRVVKLSIAGEPITLIFVAPETQDTWIKVSEASFLIPESTIDPNYYEHLDSLSRNDKTVYLQGQFPIEQREEFDAIYQQVLQSIQFR
jgi:hypothetical protein